jgi:hypothetical protein
MRRAAGPSRGRYSLTPGRQRAPTSGLAAVAGGGAICLDPAWKQGLRAAPGGVAVAAGTDWERAPRPRERPRCATAVRCGCGAWSRQPCHIRSLCLVIHGEHPDPPVSSRARKGEKMPALRDPQCHGGRHPRCSEGPASGRRRLRPEWPRRCRSTTARRGSRRPVLRGGVHGGCRGPGSYRGVAHSAPAGLEVASDPEQ